MEEASNTQSNDVIQFPQPNIRLINPHVNQLYLKYLKEQRIDSFFPGYTLIMPEELSFAVNIDVNAGTNAMIIDRPYFKNIKDHYGEIIVLLKVDNVKSYSDILDILHGIQNHNQYIHFNRIFCKILESTSIDPNSYIRKSFPIVQRYLDNSVIFHKGDRFFYELTTENMATLQFLDVALEYQTDKGKELIHKKQYLYHEKCNQESILNIFKKIYRYFSPSPAKHGYEAISEHIKSD